MIKEEDINVGLKFLYRGLKSDGTEKPIVDKDGNDIVFTVTRVILCGNDGRVERVWCDKDIFGEAHGGFNEFKVTDVLGFGIPVTEKKNNKNTEQVSHPSHYSWLKDLCGVEPIDVCRHFDFSIGNALKYLMRKGKVDGDKTEKEKRIEDLRKAVFYIEDEIKLLSDGKV